MWILEFNFNKQNHEQLFILQHFKALNSTQCQQHCVFILKNKAKIPTSQLSVPVETSLGDMWLHEHVPGTSSVIMKHISWKTLDPFFENRGQKKKKIYCD